MKNNSIIIFLLIRVTKFSTAFGDSFENNLNFIFPIVVSIWTLYSFLLSNTNAFSSAFFSSTFLSVVVLAATFVLSVVAVVVAGFVSSAFLSVALVATTFLSSTFWTSFEVSETAEAEVLFLSLFLVVAMSCFIYFFLL